MWEAENWLGLRTFTWRRRKSRRMLKHFIHDGQQTVPALMMDDLDDLLRELSDCPPIHTRSHLTSSVCDWKLFLNDCLINRSMSGWSGSADCCIWSLGLGVLVQEDVVLDSWSCRFVNHNRGCSCKRCLTVTQLMTNWWFHSFSEFVLISRFWIFFFLSPRYGPLTALLL